MKNLAGLMKQASQMQAKMEEMQSKLEALEIEGSAGAGMVTVTLSGKGDLRRIKVDPKLADPSEMEMLEDLIVAATGFVLNQVAYAELLHLVGDRYYLPALAAVILGVAIGTFVLSKLWAFAQPQE